MFDGGTTVRWHDGTVFVVARRTTNTVARRNRSRFTFHCGISRFTFHFTFHVSGHSCYCNYMMQMDARKRWMYDVDRRTSDYMAGLKTFLDVAEANKMNNFMPCPCVDCRNVKGYSNIFTLHSHLIRKGFMPSYYCWSKHGERGVMMEDNEEKEDDDNYHVFP